MFFILDEVPIHSSIQAKAAAVAATFELAPSQSVSQSVSRLLHTLQLHAEGEEGRHCRVGRLPSEGRKEAFIQIKNTSLVTYVEDSRPLST